MANSVSVTKCQLFSLYKQVQARPCTITTSFSILSRLVVKQEEEMKVKRIGKEVIKLTLFEDGMIIFSENPKEFINKLLK